MGEGLLRRRPCRDRRGFGLGGRETRTMVSVLSRHWCCQEEKLLASTGWFTRASPATSSATSDRRFATALFLLGLVGSKERSGSGGREPRAS